MTSNPDWAGALTAVRRFGFGARPGSLAEAARDPRGFVRADLAKTDAALLDAGLLSCADALARLFDEQERIKAKRERTAPAVATDRAMSATPGRAAGVPEPRMMEAAEPKPAEPSLEQKIFRAEAAARLRAEIEAEVGFVERLVAFWSNHFAISVAKDRFLRVTAGAFEREAIRPHVLGRFADMLVAVERHPAMLNYLDNRRSIGPGSKVGRDEGKGLNENLAREILELHTLGVGGGYDQADVTSFARVLTGWTVGGRGAKPGTVGAFVFRAGAHEPGRQTILGRAYAEAGEAQGLAVLADLARAPATARHLARKLARHFVADDPPEPLVDRLSRVFLDGDGDLKAMAGALIDADLAWSAPAAELRAPDEFVVAMARAAGTPPADPGPMLHAMGALGRPLWQPSSPAGFPDATAAWAAPEAMKLRLDVAAAAAARIRDVRDPMMMLDATLGPAASPETREAVARAESRQQALALLFLSPEFQRR